MKSTSHLRRLGYGLALLLIACSGSARDFGLAAYVRARFVEHACAALDDVKVTESFSRTEDRREAWRSALATDVFAGRTGFEADDIVVTDVPPTSKAHLGVLIVRYADPERPRAVHSALAKLDGVFANTEVLTRFMSIPGERCLLVLYTETSLNERVLEFLAAAPDAFAERVKRCD